jgi:hypothetical protein
MRKYPLEGRAALRFGERDELVALDREARDPLSGPRFEIALPEGVQEPAARHEPAVEVSEEPGASRSRRTWLKT